MKRIMNSCAAAAVVLAATVLAGARAVQDQPHPDLFMVVMNHVKPSMMMEYEAATKELIAALAEHNVDSSDVMFHAVSGSEMGYTYVIPLENFAAIDRMSETHSSLAQSIGAERLSAMKTRSDACVDRREIIHVRYRDDISYTPENPRLAHDEMSFIHYSFLYAMPGHEKALEQVLADFVKLYHEKDIKDGWAVHEVLSGRDLPMYLIADVGKSEADFHLHVEENEAALGADAMVLFAEGLKHLRSMETRTATIRPDLSYPPAPPTESDDG